MNTAYTGNKVQLSFWQIWNMCFGFFGIQFGWSLQMGNMSAIYEFLGKIFEFPNQIKFENLIDNQKILDFCVIVPLQKNPYSF